MKKVFEHKAKSFKEAEKWDAEFWKKAGPQARFSASWLMIKDFYKIRGHRGRQLRLRRSVQNIERL